MACSLSIRLRTPLSNVRAPILLLILLALGGAGIAAWWASGNLGDPEIYDVPPMAPEVLLLVDESDPFAGRVAEQSRFALRRARVPFAEHDLAAPLPHLRGFRAVLTAAERLDALGAADTDRLRAFVEAGGGLGVLYRGRSDRLDPFLGLPSEPYGFAPEVEGALVMTAPLMPGGENLRIATSGASAYDVPLAEGCEALAVLQDAEARTLAPAGWTCARGEGRVAFWNVALLGGKAFRGHLLQTLALVHPAHVRPVARWGVVFLDDFPAPASNAQLEPVWSQSSQTPAEYYAHTWYPDMVELAERTGLRYTSTVIYAYDGRIRPPFRFAEWLGGRVEVNGGAVPFSPWIAGVDAQRSEHALHGYNHQSLRLQTWGDKAPMVEALMTARRRWEIEGFSPLPRTYVPPMNYIDSVGVAALREAFPETRTIAGLYTGEFEMGEGREYGPEPWAPELYALPRNTAGYILTDAERLKMLSVLHTIGVWNHFVHPDEVYPNDDREEVYREEGLPSPTEIGWSGGLLPAFERWVAFVQEHYPWLEFATADEAATRMRAFDALETSWAETRERGRRRLDVSASQARQTFYTWTSPDEAVLRVDGARVVSQWEGTHLRQVVIEADGPQFSITFGSPDA